MANEHHHGEHHHGITKGATPAIVALLTAGIEFVIHEFDPGGADRGFGKIAADGLGVRPNRVFKTLIVTVEGAPGDNGHTGPRLAVGIVPVSNQLSLKLMSSALGSKRVDMCERRAAEKATGYVAGGMSPLGQKKLLPTVIDESCILFETIFISAGRRGMDIELASDQLVRALGAIVAPIAAEV